MSFSIELLPHPKISYGASTLDSPKRACDKDLVVITTVARTYFAVPDCAPASERSLMYYQMMK